MGFNYTNQFSSSDLPILVCGNEQVILNSQKLGPLKLQLLKGQKTQGFDQYVLKMDQLRPYFSISNLTESHSECFIDNFYLFVISQNKFIPTPSDHPVYLDQAGLL